MEALEKVRIGVIGCGSIGRHHMKQIQTLENACITAACDIETNNLSTFGHEAGLENGSLYTDYSDLLESGDVDAVVICLPNRFHAPVSIEAFEQGFHVFCEKPMAMNYGEAEKMIEASVKSGRKLQIGLQNRFRGESKALKERIDRGVLGNVYYSKCGWLRRSGLPPWGSWFMRRKDSGGGPTMDIGVHVLDLAFWLMSDFSVKTVYASSYSKLAPKISKDSGVFDVEDLASALIKMANGATLMFEASWVTHIEGPRFYVELMGENAGVDYTSTTFYSMDGEKPFDENVPYKEVNPYLEEMKHFLDCIISDQPPLTKPNELLGLQLTLDMINKSSREDRVVHSSEYRR